jgi:hypothetical protein
VLAIGPMSLAASYPALFAGSPVRLDGGRLSLQINSVVDRAFTLVGMGRDKDRREKLNGLLLAADDFAGISSFRSPIDSKRFVVAVLSSRAERLPALAERLADPAQNARVQGDLTIQDDGGFSGFRVGPTVWSGDLPLPVAVMWWLSRNPILLALGVTAGALAIAGVFALSLKARERRRLAGGSA